jgi:phospholipid/cholesterol/gamma-HCH transport system substrate-binding protein
MKSTEAKVGAFVVICVAFLMATVYYVSNTRFNGTQVPYRTYLRNAQGMEPGSSVLFGGITVGKVTAKSMAAIGTVSLMSSPALAISTGANNAPRLKAWAIIPSQETITLDEMQRKIGTLAESAQTTLATVNKDLNDLTGDGRQLLANLNDATDTTNRKHLAGILAHSDAMVAQLSPRIDQISERVLKLTGDVDVVVGKMGPTVDNANGTITAIREPAQADLAQLEKALQETRGLISSLDVLVRTNSQNTTYTIENLRLATDNLNDLTQSVKERPWSLVRIKQPKDRQVPK